MLTVEGLTKRFGGFTAVANVSFAVDPGEITDITRKNIHYLILAQPDFVKCDLVSGTGTNDRLADLHDQVDLHDRDHDEGERQHPPGDELPHQVLRSCGRRAAAARVTFESTSRA